MKYVIFILLAVLIPSCSVEEPSYSIASSVDEELLPYVRSFEDEASLRGISVNWSDHHMTVGFADIETNAVGRCLTYTDASKKIELDKSYWNNQSAIGKEFVIFHELGHCILDRSHLDTADALGRCISIMHSSDDLCRNNYTARTRDAFLDELFL